MGNDLAGRIAELVGPTVEALGYGLVRTQVTGRERVRVQIMIERADGAPMQVDDCAEVSRTVSAVLDVADPIRSTYVLEVSSPGIDRPLVAIGDFDRFAGFEAKVELRRLWNGRRKYQGRLSGTDGQSVRIEDGGAVVALPFEEIQRAKLVLTDELLKSVSNDAQPGTEEKR